MPEKSKSGIGMFYVSLLRQSGIDNNAQSVTADYCLVRHCPLLHSAQLCHVTGPWRQARLFTCCKDSLVMVESPELLRTFQFPFSFLCRLLYTKFHVRKGFPIKFLCTIHIVKEKYFTLLRVLIIIIMKNWVIRHCLL